MRNVHISTKLQFKGKPLPVDHGESEILRRHLAVANKSILVAIPAKLYEGIRMNSVNIASNAGTGFSHCSTSASIIVINKTRLF